MKQIEVVAAIICEGDKIICKHFSEILVDARKMLKNSGGRNHGTFLEKSWCFLMEIMVISPGN